MRAIDVEDPRTVELLLALAATYSRDEMVLSLFSFAKISHGRYPRRAETQEEAWRLILRKLRPGEIETLLTVVVTDERSAKVRPIVKAFLEETTPANQGSSEDNDALLPEEAHIAKRPARDDLVAPTSLLHEVFSSRLGKAALRRARELAARLGVLHKGDELFDVTRLAIEYQLLTADELTASLIVDLAENRSEDKLDHFAQLVAEATSLREIELRVDHAFFGRAAERCEDWTKYFESIAKLRPDDAAVTTTLFRIRAKGFVVPQFLVAGLLAEFDDDWNPIINEYENQIGVSSAFASYQTSLWNTWLMWGPSIPICSCDEWRGLYAYQFGYGDEDNSLPLTFYREKHLPFESSGGYPADRFVGAKLSRVVGRLRWAPWTLRSSVRAAEKSGEIELLKAPHVETARAQRVIYTRTRRPDGPRPTGDRSQALETEYVRPLVFQGDAVCDGDAPERSYFSAYQWLMFLVARTASASNLRRLDLEEFPSQTARRGDRMGERLWRDLVPVYVHANIADADALALQRRALIRNAVSTLQHLWEERETLFPRVPAEELRFYLVGGSDFSGCGNPVRFAPAAPLVAGLRASLQREDAAFREAVLIPAEGAPPPAELVRFYATCQLPELIEDYFQYVRDLREP